MVVQGSTLACSRVLRWCRLRLAVLLLLLFAVLLVLFVLLLLLLLLVLFVLLLLLFGVAVTRSLRNRIHTYHSGYRMGLDGRRR